jgi:5-methylcytosine-specific restriction endonuclease McrA
LPEHYEEISGGLIVLRPELKKLLRAKYENLLPVAAKPKEEPKKRAKRKKIKAANPMFAEAKNEFYQSWDWRKLRMDALNHYGRKCMSCNSTDAKLCVDHVKPLHTHWNLRLDAGNLQILCDECNMGKATEQFDFRPPNTKMLSN